ncbi:MAG: hypothetical protein KAS39_07235 [Actinomycetia bacterium]|nr:hypothetical protein [Actinomycetes bacterium]
MEKEIGKVTHYFGKINVGIFELKDELNVGDTVHVKGHTTDFKQKIESIQVEHKTVDTAKKGDSVGVKVSEHVREGDIIFKVTDED